MANLTKISLEKGKPVSLEKTVSGLGKVTVNLNWHKKVGSGGFLGLFKREQSIDLDLGCLYELADGRKSAIQALGSAWGSYDAAPFVTLSGDDRTGESDDGEFIFINGANWDKIRRVLVYSFIYDGVVNWSGADGVVTVTTGDQAVEARLDSHDASKTMCAVAMIENVDGAMKVTKLVEYFRGHQEMDDHFDWGLSWVSGSKD